MAHLEHPAVAFSPASPYCVVGPPSTRKLVPTSGAAGREDRASAGVATSSPDLLVIRRSISFAIATYPLSFECKPSPLLRLNCIHSSFVGSPFRRSTLPASQLENRKIGSRALCLDDTYGVAPLQLTIVAKPFVTPMVVVIFAAEPFVVVRANTFKAGCRGGTAFPAIFCDLRKRA
jgi:hypothetical protein